MIYHCASRDGSVYGCGSTEYGQLPYLRFAAQQGEGYEEEAGPAEGSSDEGDREPRDEVTCPTRLKLPFLQVQI